MSTRLKRVLRVSSAATAMSLAPLAFSADGGVKEQQACAQSGTCCAESTSICVIGGQFARDYYFKSSGSCIIVE